MADPIDTGGPAFPCEVDSTQPLHRQVGNTVWQTYGLTMRDYFAAKAMARLINGPAAQNICDRDPRYDETNFADVVAVNAYEFADAMLKARTA
jgi:hypothetical protein